MSNVLFWRKVMKNILVIADSNLEVDPRVYKQVFFLKEKGYNVTTWGQKPSGIEDDFILLDLKNVPLDKLKKSFSINKMFLYILGRLRKYTGMLLFILFRIDYFYWSSTGIRETLEKFYMMNFQYDLIIANDIPVLPLALKIAKLKESPVYLDAHEYEPLHHNTLLFKFFFQHYWYFICKRDLPNVSYMTTVSLGIAEKYSKEFNVNCDLLMNLPFSQETLSPVKNNSDKIKLIHQGYPAKDRHIEKMIELMDYLDERYELYFMMIRMNTEYGKQLQELVKGNPRIHFVEPVTMESIPASINQYDIGLYLLNPNSFNQEMCLPNKLFEFIQARLAVAIWPSKEMARIVDTYKNGICTKEFSVIEMADKLNQLTYEDVMLMKENSHIAASKFHAYRNKETILQIIDNLLGIDKDNCAHV